MEQFEKQVRIEKKEKEMKVKVRRRGVKRIRSEKRDDENKRIETG